jgi:hypothetical protein
MGQRPLSDRPEPRPESPGGHGYDNAILQVQASIVIERWLLEVPGAAEAVNAAVRAHIRATELARRARAAQQADRDAARRHATLLDSHDTASRRTLGFGAGLVSIVLLIACDAILLSLAAQALAAGPLPAALVQSGFLTAVAAGLGLCGLTVLARTQSLGLSRSSAAARRARLAAVTASRAHTAAVRKLELCIDGIRQMLLSWALSSVAPAKVDRASWLAALERAAGRLFPPS